MLLIPVHIATKPYIRAWLENKVPDGRLTRQDYVGAVIMNMLKRDTDPHGNKSVTYTDKITLYINRLECCRQGGWLNITETMQFNKMMGEVIRKELRTYIHTYMHFDPRLSKAIEYARKQTGMIDNDVLSYEAIVKDFQRDRQQNGGVRVYKKGSAA